MAIQVNGTTVIDNSRNLTNVGGLKTIGGTGIIGSGDIAVGQTIPAFDPSATPNWSRTSSGTWTKPTLASGVWVVIHLVGGGGAGAGSTWNSGGNGGNALVVGAIASTLPSSIAFTLGAGGAGTGGDNADGGGSSSFTVSGRTFTAAGALGNETSSSNYSALTNPLQPSGVYLMVNSGQSPFLYDGSGCSGGATTKNGTNYTPQNAEFGGGAGAGLPFSARPQGGGTAGTSSFAGNGGTFGNNGQSGGGGGGGFSDGDGGDGGAGIVKIWYIS